MEKIIIRLNDANNLQPSPEGVKLNKLTSSISPTNFLKLLKKADNKVNPRIAKVNRITRSIRETLESTPELLWLKAKGLLVATESCRKLDRGRLEMTFDNEDFEGIMDGGHTTFAIATHIIESLFDVTIKTWEELKEFIAENYEKLLVEFKERANEFQFSVPIEIITPNGESGSTEQYYDYIAEICSARNNNVQLNETAKGNQVGFYDYLKEVLDDDFEVIWKTGGHGKIKSEDVISLATLPLLFLLEHQLLPVGFKGLSKTNIYSVKSRCVDYFNSIMDHHEISKEENGKHTLRNSYVKSALSLVGDILKFFDKVYMEFPNLYHRASPGRFGGINAVDTQRESKAPFFTYDMMLDKTYPFGFIYPLVCGLTGLMEIDEKKKKVSWRVNPMEIDLNTLSLTQYVNIIKLVNFDPQKVGKGDVFYKEAESIFEDVE